MCGKFKLCQCRVRANWLEGTLIADRSGWTVKVALTTRGDAKNLIDGTNSDVARDGGAEYC